MRKLHKHVITILPLTSNLIIIIKDITDATDLSRNATVLGVYNSKVFVNNIHLHTHTDAPPHRCMHTHTHD